MNRFETKVAKPVFRKIAVIGIGLIGSSILHAVRRRGLAEVITASDNSPAVCHRAQVVGLADDITGDPAIAAADADLVILCVPVGEIARVGASIMTHLKPGSIISDVG